MKRWITFQAGHAANARYLHLSKRKPMHDFFTCLTVYVVLMTMIDRTSVHPEEGFAVEGIISQLGLIADLVPNVSAVRS